MKYEVIIYWSQPDGAFVAEIPELPGCMADGPTYAKALIAAEKVTRHCSQTARELGSEIPLPKGRLDVKVTVNGQNAPAPVGVTFDSSVAGPLVVFIAPWRSGRERRAVRQ
jgi:predicted RNase H-like HicB family nuclease